MRSCTSQQSELEAHQAFVVDATWCVIASAGPFRIVVFFHRVVFVRTSKALDSPSILSKARS